MTIKPFFRDVVLTFITEMAVLASFFLLYRLIAQYFGPQGVGEYSLVKRAAGMIQPLLLLGLGVGITRYVAISVSPERKMAFFKSGVVGVMIIAGLFLIAANIFQKEFAYFFLGSADFVSLVAPFSFFIGGLLMHSLIYSFFRGMMVSGYFNILQLLNISILPVFAFIFFSESSIGSAICFIGFLTGAFSVALFCFYAKGYFFRAVSLRPFWRELFLYSLPRCAGDILYGALFFLGPAVAAHFGSAVEAGYLSLAQGLVMALGSLIAPLGLVLLPKISGMIAQGKKNEIADGVNLLFTAIFHIGIFISFQAMIFADVAVKIWLGAELLPAVPIVRILFFSAMFYCFYAASVSILNASKNKPIDTTNLFSAIVFFIFLAGAALFILPIFPPTVSLACVFSATIIFLGILAYRSVREIYPQKITRDLFCVAVALAVNLPLAIISLSIKPFIAENLFLTILFGVILVVAYSVLFWFLNIRRVGQLSVKNNQFYR